MFVKKINLMIMLLIVLGVIASCGGGSKDKGSGDKEKEATKKAMTKTEPAKKDMAKGDDKVDAESLIAFSKDLNALYSKVDLKQMLAKEADGKLTKAAQDIAKELKDETAAFYKKYGFTDKKEGDVAIRKYLGVLQKKDPAKFKEVQKKIMENMKPMIKVMMGMMQEMGAVIDKKMGGKGMDEKMKKAMKETVEKAMKKEMEKKK